jgi:16S rRNA (adenine(1408)-N(1))-methyltransferase
MEIMRGKQTSFIDTAALADKLAGYDRVYIDIGTGDGRFVSHVAQTRPDTFVIGIDACRENLVAVSRRAPSNTLFVIANARALPAELYGIAAQVTINFPWGSLFEGLLDGDSALLEGLFNVMRPNAELEIRLNGGTLTQAGYALEDGTSQVRAVLAQNGFAMKAPIAMTAADLKTFPTTWAKSLAFGRDPRAMCLHGVRQS